MEIGSLVHLKRENADGRVVKINGNTVNVETTDGFDYLVSLSDLTEKEDNLFRQIIAVSESVTIGAIAANVDSHCRQKRTVGRKIIPVDLHANMLIGNVHGLSNHEIHQIQLKTIKEELDGMIGRHGMRIMFLHGKGDGILRNELRSEVSRRGRHYCCCDAPVERAGFQGGTIVCYV